MAAFSTLANHTAATLSNAGAGTFGPVDLLAGKYAITWQATLGGGNLQLQILSGDGSTYVNAAASMTALGLAVVDLPAGTVQVVITTSTANYVTISRIGRDA